MTRKYQRTPSVRLRFGKRDSSNFNDDEVNHINQHYNVILRISVFLLKFLYNSIPLGEHIT